MTPGEKLYERLTDELGVSIVEIMQILSKRSKRARTARARVRLARLEDEYVSRYVRDVDPRWI